MEPRIEIKTLCDITREFEDLVIASGAIDYGTMLRDV